MSNNIRSPHLSISTTIEVTSFTDKAVILVDVHYPLTYTSLNVSKWFVPRASDTVYCAISKGSKLLVILHAHLELGTTFTPDFVVIQGHQN